MGLDCQFVFKVAHEKCDLRLFLYYTEPVVADESIVMVRLFDRAGKGINSASLLRSDSVPSPYLHIQSGGGAELREVGIIRTDRSVATVKIAAVQLASLKPVEMSLFPKAYIGISRDSQDPIRTKQTRTLLIPGRPNGSTK